MQWTKREKDGSTRLEKLEDRLTFIEGSFPEIDGLIGDRISGDIHLHSKDRAKFHNRSRRWYSHGRLCIWLFETGIATIL